MIINVKKGVFTIISIHLIYFSYLNKILIFLTLWKILKKLLWKILYLIYWIRCLTHFEIKMLSIQTTENGSNKTKFLYLHYFKLEKEDEEENISCTCSKSDATLRKRDFLSLLIEFKNKHTLLKAHLNIFKNIQFREILLFF